MKRDSLLVKELLERNARRIQNNSPRWDKHSHINSLLKQLLGLTLDWESFLKHEKGKIIREAKKAEETLDKII